ncbi:MAG: feruloyl esterase [Acidobacteria bacterium 13_2_20CM_2_57_6]|nr:MAG: feruloyl esterase [Acidobacteria bacterium 13_2_20CM_2_57_6]
MLSSGAYGQNAASGTHSCEDLEQLELLGARILSAQTVAAGAFTPPSNTNSRATGDPTFYKMLPTFCRLVAEATPSADSSIKIEVWMPASDAKDGGWNGKLQGRGNGGFAGEIAYQQLGTGVSQGYAMAGTDTGHSGTAVEASWALGHPEKVVDFGYRGIHEMTLVAKAAVKAYYGKDAQHSYFWGCSNGGRQALMEAQRFPEDYDGILAGAPANFWTHLLTKALADAQATTLDPASYIPPGKLPAIARAVNAACDAQDGVSDGIVNDPKKCHFDPAALLCKEGDSLKCLTAAQVTALKKLYEGPNDAKGRKIFPGYVPGAEEGPGGWETWITGPEPQKSLLFAFSDGYFSNFVYGKADWNYKDANVDQAMKTADEKTAKILNATERNLKAFKARGGKLILYHGWNDAAISALNTINYYDSVLSKMGARESEAFARLYMVPGMQHCSGGPGADSFGQGGADAKDAQHNVETALEQWVEKGIAPNAIVATKYQGRDASTGVKMTRPLCPYPQIARYKGTGDTNDAGNFVCTAESK